MGDCIDKDLIIPSTYKGLPVNAIGENAFNGNTDITYVLIDRAVTSIGQGAINSERDFRKTQQKISNNIENSLQMIA